MNNGSKSNENQLLNMVQAIYHDMEKIGSSGAHYNIFGALGKKDVTVCVSVYNQVKPDHLILSDLIKWLESTKNTDVLKKIEVLSEDLTFQD